MFGKPNEGVHAYRFMGIAIVDFLFTVIFAILLSKFCNINFLVTLVGLLIAGVIAHRIFCVRTAVDRLLFEK